MLIDRLLSWKRYSSLRVDFYLWPSFIPFKHLYVVPTADHDQMSNVQHSISFAVGIIP